MFELYWQRLDVENRIRAQTLLFTWWEKLQAGCSIWLLKQLQATLAPFHAEKAWIEQQVSAGQALEPKPYTDLCTNVG